MVTGTGLGFVDARQIVVPGGQKRVTPLLQDGDGLLEQRHALLEFALQQRQKVADSNTLAKPQVRLQNLKYAGAWWRFFTRPEPGTDWQCC